MLVTQALVFLAFTCGTILHCFLAVLLVKKRGGGQIEKLLLAAVITGGSWHAARALAFFYQINTGANDSDSAFVSALGLIAQTGLILTPAILFHLCIAWLGASSWIAVSGYVVPPLTWALGLNRSPQIHLILGPGLLLIATLFLWAGRRSRTEREARFLRWFSAALAVPGVALIGSNNPALLTWSALVAPLCFAYFVYRYDFLGLFLSRRIIFALNLGLFAALYLLLVRRVADFVEDQFLVFGGLTELVLIICAALIWIPLYAWMNRFLSKRAELAADFSKRLVEGAARILELPKRLRFLVEQVRHTFHLHRALLIAGRKPGERALSGAGTDRLADETVDRLETFARGKHIELAHADTVAEADIAQMLRSMGFNYLFPLWYEDHLTGLLLLDTSPRLYLDEDESILLSLCRQISHSIETCRVVEEKITLERALLDQQHLARMGKAAAAIAHEVKNPLSSIKTLAELMQEDAEVRGKYERDLSYMIGAVDRLNGSVQQLLSFAKPVRKAAGDVDLTALLDRTAGVLARQHEPDHITIALAPGPPLEVKQSDSDLIEQIVLNLLVNAIQVSESGAHVTIHAGCQGPERVGFSVEDEGPGIPAELQDRIFEPFYTTKQKGTGLGLAIVKRNVEELGGEIRVESPIDNGRGTRMTVVLPARGQFTASP
jgi:signal transduction histidine kinase